MPRELSDDEIEDFRADLCRAAEQLFLTKGDEGVTMRALAAEVGCSAMTPYRYFANKGAILDAVRLQAFERHGAFIERETSQVNESAERLLAYGRAYVAFARKEPQSYRMMFELHARHDGSDTLLENEASRNVLLQAWRPLVAVLEELVEQGHAYGDPLELAHLAWITLHGLVTLELSQKLNLGRSLDELIEPALEYFLRGIGTPPEPRDSGAPHDPPREST